MSSSSSSGGGGIATGETERVLLTLRDASTGISLLARLPATRRQAENVASRLGSTSAATPKAESAKHLAVLGQEIQRTADLEQKYRDMLKEKAAAEKAAAIAAAAAALSAATSIDEDAGVQPVATATEDEGPKEDPALALQYASMLRILRADTAAADSALPPLKTDGPENGLSALAATINALESIASRRLGSTRQQLLDLEVEMSNKLGRIDNAEREVALLQQELTKQRAMRAKAAGELEESLRKLRDDLVQSQTVAAAELQSMQTTGSQKSTQLSLTHAKNDAHVQAQIEKLQTELKTQADAHIDAEANLRKRRARARLEVETLIKEYDTAQSAIFQEIEAVKKTLANEALPLADLKRYYSKVDAELGRLEEERLIAERKYFLEVTVEDLRKRIAGMAILRFYKPLKQMKVEQEKWEAKQKAAKANK
jgi:hypothetical protein